VNLATPSLPTKRANQLAESHQQGHEQSRQQNEPKMSQGLLDTSVFIAQESGRAISLKHIPEQVAVSVVTLAELQLGVLLATNASVRRRRLATYRNALQFEPIPIDNAVGDEWAELRSNLGAGKKSLTANDLWIAATARHLGVPLITQDRELAKIPGVQVIVV
jgi:predicted nucleic acid-binding protein